jgi:MFS family permease
MATLSLSGPFIRVTVANFFFFLNFASFFLLPLHLHALGADRSTVGAVMGTNGLAAFAFLPVVGTFIDRVGRRRFLLGGAAGMGLAAAIYPSVDTVGPALFALRVLQGVSFAAAFTATTTYAAALAPAATRAQALGVFGLSTLLTHAIAPGLGEEIINRFGFTTLFYCASACTAVVLIIAVGLPLGAGDAASRPQPGAPGGLTRMHWVIAATTVLAGMGFGTVITFVAAYVHHEGLGRAGFFFGAYTTAAILVRITGAGLSDRFGRPRVILPTLAALSTEILLLSLARSTAFLMTAGLLFGAAQGINYPTLHAYVVDLSRGTNLGRAQALFNGAFNLGVTGSSFLFGLIAELFGYRLMFALAAVTPMLACALFYLLQGADQGIGPATEAAEQPISDLK